MTTDIKPLIATKCQSNFVKDRLPPLGTLVMIRWDQSKLIHGMVNGEGPLSTCFAILELWGQTMLKWKIGEDRYMEIRTSDEWSFL